jgi:hypothetical protein
MLQLQQTYYYSPPTTDPAINLSFYAAGRCRGNISGFTDWYLPAACELGYEGPLTVCGPAATPVAQNMQSNLFDNGVGNLRTDEVYWSSTQASATGGGQAFFNDFTFQMNRSFKSNINAVRCARQLTI